MLKLNFMNLQKSFALGVSAFAIVGVLTSGVNAFAAIPPTPVVTPASAIDDSTNPIYAADLTSCFEIFNWTKYLADLAAGITNSNPYDKQDCVRQPNIAFNGTRTVTKNGAGQVTAVNYAIGAKQISKTLYKDFAIGQAGTKTAFGNLPVLGVFPNGTYTAQALNSYDIDGTTKATVANVDRSDKAGLSSIFLGSELSQIYSTGGNRNGMPRIPYTGADQFVNNTWLGGFCKVEGGKLKMKNIVDGSGNIFTPADYDENINSPITTCRWPDTNATRTSNPVLFDPEGVVKDQNLAIYQYVYKIPYPKDKLECDTWFPRAFSDYTKCLDWFQTRYSLPLTGSKTGNALYYTYTYYGTFDDKYTQWVGWVNPDINKVRASFTTSATLAQLRSYYQDPEATLRQLFNDTTSSYSALVTRMNTASSAVQAQYQAILKDKFEGYIRNADGYSIYTM